jgi:hypothetical protein
MSCGKKKNNGTATQTPMIIFFYTGFLLQRIIARDGMQRSDSVQKRVLMHDRFLPRFLLVMSHEERSRYIRIMAETKAASKFWLLLLFHWWSDMGPALSYLGPFTGSYTQLCTLEVSKICIGLRAFQED